MPLKKLEKQSFIYLMYRRRSPDDFLRFRKTLVDCATADSRKRDIVVDLSDEEVVGDAEVLLLTNVIRGFLGTKRRVHISAPEPLRRKLETHNIFKTENAVAYGSRNELLKSLNERPASEERKSIDAP